MKFFKSLLIALLCTVMLTACATQKGVPLPSSSANFDEEFLSTFQDEYYIYDGQLVDVSTVPWEAEKILSAENERLSSLRFAMVEQYPEKEFVSVTEVHDTSPSVISNCRYGLRSRIYQNTEICPIRDWEISEITVLRASNYYINLEERLSSDLHLPKTKSVVFQNDEPAEMYGTFTSKNDPDMIELFRHACESPEKIQKDLPKMLRASVENVKSNSADIAECMLLVRFAHCSQIAWVGGIYMQGQNLYVKCPYTDENGNRDYGYCLLPEEFATEVLQIFKENCISVGTDLK